METVVWWALLVFKGIVSYACLGQVKTALDWLVIDRNSVSRLVYGGRGTTHGLVWDMGYWLVVAVTPWTNQVLGTNSWLYPWATFGGVLIVGHLVGKQLHKHY